MSTEQTPSQNSQILMDKNSQILMDKNSQNKIEKATRKKRLTKKEMQDFIEWAFSENVFEKYTGGKIKQMYHDLKGIDLTEATIRAQKKRYSLVDGQIVDSLKKVQ